MTDSKTPDTKFPAPVAHAKMRPKPGSPPGLELDGKANVIPLEKRTLDDQQKAASASSVKNPNHEAENPSPMPREQQGQGGGRRKDDPEGQQGGQR